MYRKSIDSGQRCNKQNILTGKTTELVREGMWLQTGPQNTIQSQSQDQDIAILVKKENR